MNTLDHRLRNPQRAIPTLVSRSVTPQHEDSWFPLEEFSDDIRAEVPQLPNLAYREMALFKARRRRFIRTV
jgi:hypothetical protein